MATTSAHEGFLATFAGIARALKFTETELRSVLRGKDGEYIQPVKKEAGGLYGCPDVLLFSCIATLRSAMTPAQRDSLRNHALKDTRWKDAHRDGAHSQVWLFIHPDKDDVFLGSQEEWTELCQRKIYKGALIVFQPVKLDVGRTSDTVHAALRQIAAAFPDEVHRMTVWAMQE